ncbi:type II secretion system protein [Patescibacteria group bacterium]
MKKKGFTLIEMLIVIAVIGILAIAVLSAINPVEQTRKARDARRRSNAAELLNAIERYYTTFEENSSALVLGIPASDVCGTIAAAGAQVVPADLADFVNTNEVKPEFTDRITSPSDYLFAGLDTTTELVRVCYEIESEANIVASGGGTCGVGTSSYICLPE